MFTRWTVLMNKRKCTEVQWKRKIFLSHKSTVELSRVGYARFPKSTWWEMKTLNTFRNNECLKDSHCVVRITGVNRTSDHWLKNRRKETKKKNVKTREILRNAALELVFQLTEIVHANKKLPTQTDNGENVARPKKSTYRDGVAHCTKRTSGSCRTLVGDPSGATNSDTKGEERNSGPTDESLATNTYII